MGLVFSFRYISLWIIFDCFTMDDFVNKYPFGFYDMDTMINIGDNYIKTGKVLFSEMY